MNKILVLDDNLDILEMVEEVLAYEHFEVKAVSDSVDFIELVLEFSPDLILLDYLLRDGNGGELCRQIKSHPKLKHIPVIIFSAYVIKDSDIKECACDGLIMKPFNLEDLVNKINGILPFAAL
jgi:CheY-like chemotaxis protein